ncbi:PDR/VanB family oxidoreductase [Arthrobacter sp. ZGTC412]|uniref:PDR/VanB family oxidoreductase n=1 Tax=Arthrobacter sp. ZGTC412 TaxID=2058900 RepID=UPI001C665C06|nr:PDR/VanB family oxidoreductase [Arthrobacter sp. ZGTC412]
MTITQNDHRTMAMKPDEYEADVLVEAKDIVADGVTRLTLRHARLQQLPNWTPGAHIDLIMPSGLVRQYSLMGDPADIDRWQVGILREPSSRGGSSYIHDELSVGDLIRVRGPRNHFELEPAKSYHFIAGGIGITPILAMLRSAEAAGIPWRLTYGGRQKSSMGFLAELEEYGDKVELVPQDTHGHPDLPGIVAGLEPGGLIYSCGPEGLLNAVEGACLAAGAPAPKFERFAPKSIVTKPDEEFEIELQDSGMTLQVPADKSILSVLRAAGVHTVASCEEGTCGTCEVGVAEGTPEHRDSVLSAEEQAKNDCMMICVSRACSKKLVLEI